MTPNNSAYPDHPWRRSRFLAQRQEDFEIKSHISRDTMTDNELDIPALTQHFRYEETT